jgi:serine/threonine-protein kinase
MPGVTASILIIVGRAILIPSGAVRTAVIGAATTVILGSTSAFIFRQSPNPLVSENWVLGGVYSALWCITASVLGTVSSAVLYKLQKRARVADELGQYHLEEKIGEGGMGVVYRARHAMLRRPTAVKLLPSDRAGEHAIARFEKEVQLTSRLAHPNTIAIYDYGRTPEGVFYYAMEYVDGFDLECVVELTGPLPAARVVHVLLQTCEALDEAHSLGLIHRDIKPANILLCERARMSDVVKVVDFGLVKDVEDGDTDASGENAIVGTPLFLAPEAILDPANIDARSDLYSLGCVAYFLVTGHPPFEGTNTLAVFAEHLQVVPEPPSKFEPVPQALEQLIMRCLAKNPDDRPATAAGLAELLRALPIEPWSESEAHAWWEQNGDRLRVHRTAVSASGKTLAVDLSQRV